MPEPTSETIARTRARVMGSVSSPPSAHLTASALRRRRRRLERRRVELLELPDIPRQSLRRFVAAWRRLELDELRVQYVARPDFPCCGARTRSGRSCRARPVFEHGIPRNGRCRLHGGLSTGPRRSVTS